MQHWARSGGVIALCVAASACSKQSQPGAEERLERRPYSSAAYEAPTPDDVAREREVERSESDAERADLAPDDTGRNAATTQSGALTPLDQGNDARDLELAQRIRQSIWADDSLSFDAKNAKVISREGRVTLRGVVEDAGEKAKIAAFAQSAGAVSVDDQLEVKK